MAQNGLSFDETLVLVGKDAGVDDPLHSFSGPTPIPIPAGVGPVQVARTLQRVVPRSALQEDSAPNNADEIFARITVTPSGPPVGDTDNTAIVVLPD
ncbi:hypothetical protein F0U59_34740 [Archangium gephyra]|nr:hypothetical protein F0U59_34740 [Archangium gephyra]